jgi:hypothetical protein
VVAAEERLAEKVARDLRERGLRERFRLEATMHAGIDPDTFRISDDRLFHRSGGRWLGPVLYRGG